MSNSRSCAHYYLSVCQFCHPETTKKQQQSSAPSRSVSVVYWEKQFFNLENA